MEWLLDDDQRDIDDLTNADLFNRLLLSLVFGFVVAVIYVFTQRRSRTELIPFATTIVLLTVLIAMVTLVIGSNVARAFSLAGALAIIRFRTVVEDTRDTAFVIFAVVVGMGVGAGMSRVSLIGAPILAAAAVLLGLFEKPMIASAAGFSLSVRMGLGRDPGALLNDVFTKYLSSVSLKATATARQGAALDLSYVVQLRKDAEGVSFVSALNQVEGVQNVELRQQ